MPSTVPIPPIHVAFSAPPSGNVKVEMLRLFKYQATNLNRPRVNRGSTTSAAGPLHNAGLFVGLDIFGIAKTLTKRMERLVHVHEVVHALYDLRAQGLVRFHPTKNKALVRQLSGSSMAGSTPIGEVPVRIQLTPKGLERAEYTEAAPVNALPKEPEPRAVEPLPTAPIPQPAKEEPTVAATAYAVSTVVDIGAYPEIRRLAHSEQNMRQAVASLRAAGQNELAQMAEDAIGERTPLEQEVIHMAHALLAAKLVVDEGGDA